MRFQPHFTKLILLSVCLLFTLAASEPLNRLYAEELEGDTIRIRHSIPSTKGNSPIPIGPVAVQKYQVAFYVRGVKCPVCGASEESFKTVGYG